MANNVIFSAAAKYNTSKARHRNSRIELLSKDVADELNTYRTFGVFKSYADTFKENVEQGTGKLLPSSNTKGNADHPGTPAVRSIFNKYSAVLTGNTDPDWESKPMDSVVKSLVQTAQEIRLSNNAPLLDTPETRKKLRSVSGCSVRELVQASQQGYFGRATYSYADFMYCKHLGKVPNNYLITVRRYPAPISDGVMPSGIGPSRKKGSAGFVDSFLPIGTMITWMGVSGNDMKNILKYSYSMAFQEKSAQWNQLNEEGGESGILNGLEAMINPATRRAMAGGETNAAFQNTFGSFFNVGPGFAYKPEGWDDTKVYGPIDRVKKTYMRGSDGLDTKQSFQLVFEYELKAYNGINPRQAMLDLLASIYSVTYTTGNFWGGGYTSSRRAQSSAFQNLNIFKCNGGFTDFMDAFIGDVSTMKSEFLSGFGIQSGDNLIDSAKKILNGIGGVLMGGLLNKLGRPMRYFANSLISDAPVGLWHITIGNPHHPIMALGNMILKETEIEHSGPLGLDDFPTNLKVTCTFDRGKPRDQRELEAMYMSGQDRIFHSMEGAIASMYSTATEYKHKGNKSITASAVPGADVAGPDKFAMPEDTTTKTPEKTNAGQVFIQNITSELSKVSDTNILNYYFGDVDAYALVSSAKELGHGMAKRAKKETDSK